MKDKITKSYAMALAVRPKNSAEVRWRIEAQGLLKDSPLCDEATPIAAYRCRRLDQPIPTSCHRIPPGRESHSPGSTRWQTQALHRRPAHSASAQSQTPRPTPPGEIGHPRYSRYPPLVPCPGRQKVDLSPGRTGSCPPVPPQTRASPIKAHGSSTYSFAP